MNNIFISTACLKGDKNYDRVINEFIDNDIKNIELTGVHPFLKIDELEKKINNFISTGIEWVPINSIKISKDKNEDLINFFESLEEDEDVQNIYSNAEFIE